MDIILTKFEDTALTLRENLFEGFRRAIAKSDPYDLGWKTEKETSLMKIGVLLHDDEVVIAGKFPNYRVICIAQTNEAHMGRTGVESFQGFHQARR